MNLYYTNHDIPFFRKDNLLSLQDVLTSPATVYEYRDNAGLLRFALETNCPVVIGSLGANLKVRRLKTSIPENFESVFTVLPHMPPVSASAL